MAVEPAYDPIYGLYSYKNTYFEKTRKQQLFCYSTEYQLNKIVIPNIVCGWLHIIRLQYPKQILYPIKPQFSFQFNLQKIPKEAKRQLNKQKT